MITLTLKDPFQVPFFLLSKAEESTDVEKGNDTMSLLAYVLPLQHM